MAGPLQGITVIEMAGMGPVPFCATMCADMGARVIRIDRPDTALDPAQAAARIVGRGTRSIALDLRAPEGVAAALRLVERADVLLEGFRPGVMEKLGLGPQHCLARNPRLVYGRMTGWGQDGPLAHSAGHDLNYIALAGALACIGPQGGPPVPPLNLIGDYGGGAMMLAFSVVSALLAVKNGTAAGQTIDMGMSDGAAMLMLPIYGLLASKRWRAERGANVLDGGAPFYRCYRCRDGRWISIASIEAKFHAALLQALQLDAERYGPQHDRQLWNAQAKILEDRFLSRTRDEWCRLLEGTDVCFAPVLDVDEAPSHPHNAARGTFVDIGGVTQPAPPARFSRTPCEIQGPPPTAGAHTREVLREYGFGNAEIEQLTALRKT